jgi:tetratricopeptide (TPR) repeat protein
VRKKILFTFIALALSCLVVAALEGVLRVFDYGGDTRLFVPAEAETDRFLMCNRQIARQYFPTLTRPPMPAWDAFRKEKPAEGFRMFVLGGSTAAGFPYGNNLMFSRILNVKLRDVFPDKKIEIVNTAMTAVNTYTQLDFMDEIIAQQPDAILIYSGHNEFYGALGVASRQSLGRSHVVARMFLELNRLKLFALLRNAIGALRNTAQSARTGGSDFDPGATLMERMVDERNIDYGSPLYQKGVRQFADNLDRIYRKAQQAGIPVVISELVSNIRDQRPFRSVRSDSTESAEDVFRKAKALDKQGDYPQAKKHYLRARDLDTLRFRASGQFNDIIHTTAHKYGGPVVPMQRYFEDASPQSIIGDNLMVDHLHPNVDGCFIMAEAFFNTLKDAGLISRQWDAAKIKPMDWYQENWGMTALDLACAELRIKYLKGGWPFKPRSVPNRTLESFHPQTRVEELALRVLTDDNESIITGHYKLARRYLEQKNYLAAYEQYRALYHTVPWRTSFLNGAANCLLGLKRYDEVPPLLYRSLEIKETFFAQRWLGHLLVNQRKFDEAITVLEKARAEHPDNRQVLVCLEKAYQYTGRADRAAAIRNKLNTLSPADNSPSASP